MTGDWGQEITAQLRRIADALEECNKFNVRLHEQRKFPKIIIDTDQPTLLRLKKDLGCEEFSSEDFITIFKNYGEVKVQ